MPCHSGSESSCPGPTPAAVWRAHGPQNRGPRILLSVSFPTISSDQYGPLVALTVGRRGHHQPAGGLLVFGNDYRHPVALAKGVAALDLFSEGRVESAWAPVRGPATTSSRASRAGEAGAHVSRMAEAWP